MKAARSGRAATSTLAKRRTDMNRKDLSTIGMGLFLSVGLLAAAQGVEANGSPQCTLATLKGRYLFGSIAPLLPAPGVQLLLAAAGYHVFNGDGTGKDLLSATIDGVSQEKQFSNPD